MLNNSVLRDSSLNGPVNDSANPFSLGDPGAMSTVLVVLLASHQTRRARAMNSGPLSDRMNAGAGYWLVSSSRTTSTSLALPRLPTWIVRQRRLCCRLRQLRESAAIGAGAELDIHGPPLVGMLRLIAPH